jgi:hypothetical protein
MKYKEFISAVKHNQPETVNALNLPESSAPDAIPKKFSALIPEILNIIDKNFNELADGMSTIGVFGLQPVGFTPHSNTSIKKNGCATSHSLLNHLWCVLYFLPTNSLSSIKSWGNFKSIVIDFTKGIVIDQERYLHCVIHSKGTGKIYGKINPEKLYNAWRNLNA